MPIRRWTPGNRLVEERIIRLLQRGAPKAPIINRYGIPPDRLETLLGSQQFITRMLEKQDVKTTARMTGFSEHFIQKIEQRKPKPSQPPQRPEDKLVTTRRPKLIIPEGYLTVTQVIEAAKSRGIDDASRIAFKRLITKRIIRPDLKVGDARPLNLFRQERLDDLIAIIPRQQQAIPKGFTTTYGLLEQAQQINPKVYLSHIQQFLKVSRNNPRLQAAWVRKLSNITVNKKEVCFHKK